jgi:aminoglycoside phosphotransferase (APT) family kinase protein
MHSDELDIDVDLVARLVAKQFPAWADLSLTPIPPGTVNAMFRLGGEKVVRLPRVHWWAADLDRELEILPRLNGHTSLRVPEPLGRGTPTSEFPFNWAIYGWIPGHPWSEETVVDRAQAAHHLADFVSGLRNLDASGAPVSRRGESFRTQDLKTRDAIAALGGAVDGVSLTRLWVQALPLPDWSGEPVWVHGDLMPTNILADDAHLTGVIDFGLSGVGDPAIDMLPAWSVFERAERVIFRETLGPDEATWQRGRAWALSLALQIIPYYAKSAPHFADLGRRMLSRVVEDVEG